MHTIELREKDASIAQGFFDESPLKEKIIMHVGDAQNIIPTLNEKWDLVFIKKLSNTIRCLIFFLTERGNGNQLF